MAVVLLVSALPLVHLARFSLRDSFYSYIVLIPAVSVYLAWLNRQQLRKDAYAPASRAWLALLLPGLALLAWYFAAANPRWEMTQVNRLAAGAFGFLLCFWAASAQFLGRNALRTLAFPLAFLVFITPLPSPLAHGIESLLQHGSADAAHAILKLSGTPLLREGTLFVLPGIHLEVAPECSGIRSTLVLFMASLVGGHMFFRRGSSRAILVLAVIPLGILRNAIRIFTIAQLCIHIGPHMVDSPIHRRGGPIFFLASLVPFLILVWYLRRREIRAAKNSTDAPKTTVCNT
jgi:exosortase C (VPDSG-CTERM-specific)